VNYEEEASAASRLDAWEVALKMMVEHPLTGVGFSSFGQAYPYFSDTRPRIAHNTFLQVGAEYGIGAGICYAAMIFLALRGLWRRNLRDASRGGDTDSLFLYCMNEACLLGLIGFCVCSMFLSLEKYDVLYCLLILAVSMATLVRSDGGVEKVGA
jgi:O-antigen ligase